MKCHIFWGRTNNIAVTDNPDGNGLPVQHAPWVHKRTIEIYAGDGPRIGSSSAEIIDDIQKDGFHIWPRKR